MKIKVEKEKEKEKAQDRKKWSDITSICGSFVKPQLNDNAKWQIFCSV
jgi:hypothetical protein